MLVSFESIDGAGKSTQAKLLADYCYDNQIPHILTREPGTHYLKECGEMRRLLLDPAYSLCPRTSLFLYLADRAQHVNNIIRPALEQGKLVISDRFIDSTVAYQAAEGIFRREDLEALNTFATENLVPDITFWIDLDPIVASERAKQKQEYKGGDRMEKKGLEFQKKVNENFRKLYIKSNRTVRVDGAASKESNAQFILKTILDKILDEGL